MSIWSWLLKRDSAAAPVAEPPRRMPEPRAVFTDADRAYVRAALDRFEACGLRVRADLDRDLIVVRALIDSHRWGFGGEKTPPAIGLALKDDPIRQLFDWLVIYADDIAGYADDTQQMFPRLLEMDDGSANDMVDNHSASIFENASEICAVQEGDGMSSMVCEIAGLSCGAVAVEDAEGFLAEIKLHGKHPDITPVIQKFNAHATTAGDARFVLLESGSSDTVIVMYLSQFELRKSVDLLKLRPSRFSVELASAYE